MSDSANASAVADALASRPEPDISAAAATFQAAVACHRDQRLDDAEDLYRQVLEEVPGHPGALHLLGVIETQRGRPERGAELIRRALPFLAKNAEPHVDLGNALRLAGKREEAVECYRRAVGLKPDCAPAHNYLGAVLSELGRFETAISHSRTAVALDPASLPSRFVLAAALKSAGRMTEAAQAWREIIELQPRHGDSYHKLAGQLVSMGLLKEALHCHDRAIELAPDDALFHCARAQLLMRLYDGVRAEAGFRRALDLSPELKEGWIGLSWALRMLGRFAEADTCLDRLRQIDPTDLRAVRHIPATGHLTGGAAEIDRLATVLDGADATVDDRISAGFALGRLLDHAGRFDEAFERYAMANALVRQNWPPNTDRFDAKAFASSVDTLIRTNRPEVFAEAEAYGSMSELPVFIVGMPRSGTTLVEQICASHSRIHGAGELDDLSRIALELARERKSGADLARAGRRAADAHVVSLHQRGGGALRVLDKMPDNVVLGGLIARLFPRARIVYCSRDARDIALSCFFQLFSEGAQFFSYDLADCGNRTRDVQRLGAHWLEALTPHIIEVNYERLVTDLEGESRRLIDFLGLEWEDACIDFHRTERTVATISHWQVRQPLYSSSIGRWRQYEKHLVPLMAALHRADTSLGKADGDG